MMWQEIIGLAAVQGLTRLRIHPDHHESGPWGLFSDGEENPYPDYFATSVIHLRVSILFVLVLALL
jgi:hypothetical protein